MINNALRIASFTSSEISALTTKGKGAEGFGAPAITYINEKRMERLLGRSLSTEVNAKPLTWGKVVERRPFEILDTSYTFSSTETDQHPTIPYWAGSKDGTREQEERAVFDIKCPITLKSFCQFVMPLHCGLVGDEAIDAIRNGFEHNGVVYEKHKSGDDYYWQLVSNAIINCCDWAELIVYMPYQSELPEIRIMADGQPNAMWISLSNDDDLPYLQDGGVFQNINVIRFRVPQVDKDFLTKQVLKAGELLLK